MFFVKTLKISTAQCDGATWPCPHSSSGFGAFGNIQVGLIDMAFSLPLAISCHLLVVPLQCFAILIDAIHLIIHDDMIIKCFSCDYD